MSTGVNYDELDPGIRDMVRAINEWGWATTDSGDGVSKQEPEWDTSCVIPYPHVACESQWGSTAVVAEAHTLAEKLVERFGAGWYVEASYSTADPKKRFILLAMKEVDHGQG